MMAARSTSSAGSATARASLSPLALGVAFGWFLERGGMGNARKLAGQFYFTDLSVLKLMFSAILTAMLGLFWLSWAGLLDLSRVYVPETFIAPQLVGGVVFGVGLRGGRAVPGHVVRCGGDRAARRVRVDRGHARRRVRVRRSVSRDSAHSRTARRVGAWTLPQAVGLSYGTVVGIIVAAALGAFAGAERLERRVERPAHADVA